MNSECGAPTPSASASRSASSSSALINPRSIELADRCRTLRHSLSFFLLREHLSVPEQRWAGPGLVQLREPAGCLDRHPPALRQHPGCAPCPGRAAAAWEAQLDENLRSARRSGCRPVVSGAAAYNAARGGSSQAARSSESCGASRRARLGWAASSASRIPAAASAGVVRAGRHDDESVPERSQQLGEHVRPGRRAGGARRRRSAADYASARCASVAARRCAVR